MNPENTIARLNDAFRSTLAGGKVLLTQGVDALELAEKTQLLTAVMTFCTFTGDNDPWDEHDFGALVERCARDLAAGVFHRGLVELR